jgi:hypothetical protein
VEKSSRFQLESVMRYLSAVLSRPVSWPTSVRTPSLFSFQIT